MKNGGDGDCLELVVSIFPIIELWPLILEKREMVDRSKFWAIVLPGRPTSVVSTDRADRILDFSGSGSVRQS